MTGSKIIFNEESNSPHLGLNRRVTNVKDVKGNYWYVSTTVCKTLKSDETMVFASDSKGKVKDFGNPVKTYAPSNHEEAILEFLK